MIHTHPAATAEYHRLFLDHLRPALLERLRENEDCYLTEGMDDPEDAIRDVFMETPASSWSFLLMDADQPCGPGFDPPWFYRGTVECDEMHMMVQSDFSLCLHPFIGFRRVRSLLADPMFAGYPPEMHIETDMDGNESWIIVFHRGSGITWQGLTPAIASSYFLLMLEDTLDVIRTVRRFKGDYRDAAAFRALREALRAAYDNS
jgi:hypothetical protein